MEGESLVEPTSTNSDKSWKCYLMIFLNVIQLGMLVWSIIVLKYFLLFIDNWSLIICSVYLFLRIIYETYILSCRSEKLEKINNFCLNSLSKIAFPYCFAITLDYWGLLLFGVVFKVQVVSIDGTIAEKLCLIYIHLGITIIMLVELFLFPRGEMALSFKIVAVNIGIFVLYIITTVIAKYRFNCNVYPFLVRNKTLEMMSTFGIIIASVFFCTFIYDLISNRINRNFIYQNKIEINANEVNNIDNNMNIGFNGENQ